MKIRVGFVSNSSSSSFIIIGAKINFDDVVKLMNNSQQKVDSDDYYEEMEKYVKELGLQMLYNDGDYLIGNVLANIRDDEGSQLPSMEFSSKDLQEKIELIKKKINNKKFPVKLYLGTRSC